MKSIYSEKNQMFNNFKKPKLDICAHDDWILTLD